MSKHWWARFSSAKTVNRFVTHLANDSQLLLPIKPSCTCLCCSAWLVGEKPREKRVANFGLEANGRTKQLQVENRHRQVAVRGMERNLDHDLTNNHNRLKCVPKFMNGFEWLHFIRRILFFSAEHEVRSLPHRAVYFGDFSTSRWEEREGEHYNCKYYRLQHRNSRLLCARKTAENEKILFVSGISNTKHTKTSFPRNRKARWNSSCYRRAISNWLR